MSMNAVFVQVQEAEAAFLKANPNAVESLFADTPAELPIFAKGNFLQAAQDRVQQLGPKMMAETLSRMDPKQREVLEARLGRTTAELAAGQGGSELLKLMTERSNVARQRASLAAPRNKLSLEKEWHGVTICFAARPNLVPAC